MFGKLLSCSLLFVSPVMAQDLEMGLDREAQAIKGSDTMAGYMVDMIEASGLKGSLSYVGGGSGQGETALVEKTQRITAMSRAFSAAQLAKAEAAGIKVVEHVVGLDGVSVIVNAGNAASALNFDQIKKIYSCEITNWSAVGGSNTSITVYRRNDASGTTDTFKSLLGLASFGPCVKILAETSDVAQATSTDATAVGYSGLSALQSGNKALAVSKDSASKGVEPTRDNIRKFAYPLTRKLFVYEAKNSLNAVEATLMSNVLDRSVSDPLIEKHEFITLD